MKKLASVAAVAVVSSIAWSSSAQEIKFGDKGTLAIHAATGSPMLESSFSAVRLGATPFLGFQTETFTTDEVCNPQRCQTERDRYTSFYLNPRMHFFVIDNLSIGGEILFATYSGKHIEERVFPNGVKETVESETLFAPTGFGLMPLIGYNIRLGDKFSIWPQGGIGFRHFSWEPNANTEFGETWWFANVDVPFMLHIAPHFSLGAGPGATFTLSQERKQTILGRTDTFDHTTTMWRWFNAHLIGYF
jgi:hypothetical protein